MPPYAAWPSIGMFVRGVARIASRGLIHVGLRRLAACVMSLVLGGIAIAASNVVEYTYDAAGNITNVARQPSPGFAITSFDPTSGAVGATVTIYGTGFSATPANNTVRCEPPDARLSGLEIT